MSTEWGSFEWGGGEWGSAESTFEVTVAIAVVAPSAVVVYPAPTPAAGIIEVVAPLAAYLIPLTPSIIDVVAPTAVARVPHRFRHEWAVLVEARQRITHTWRVVPQPGIGARITHTWRVRMSVARIHHRWRVLEVDPVALHAGHVQRPIAQELLDE